MVYAKQLPPMRQLRKISQQASFPATRAEFEEVAQRMELPRSVMDFLKLFPADETFESRVEFVARCEELEILITQIREAPQEILHSQQD